VDKANFDIKSNNLTQDRLKELLHYDPVTGVFTRLTKAARCVNIGDTAGFVASNGHVHIKINSKGYSAHQLAWLYITGEWSKTQINHNDGNSLNNWFDNLRNTAKEKCVVELTQKRAIELLNYNLETGIFTWKALRKGRCIGDVAGCQKQDGYVSIRLDDRLYLAHRVAWLFVFGSWPIGDIDHKDGCPSHNWIDNLRDVSKSGNMQNRKKATIGNKSTGILGVYLHKPSGKFKSSICLEGKQKHLGFFVDAKVAHNVYLNAKRKLHPCNTI
jgi:hypothetical protein